MKIYSDNTVTKEDLINIESSIDAKQNQQIRELKLGIVGAFVLNLAFSIILFIFFR